MEYRYSSSEEEYLFLMGWERVDESYRPLPLVYLCFLIAWSISALSWGVNTWRNSHIQMNKLQWTLFSIPLVKSLQLGSSYLFWSSCIKLQLCSLWMSFGAYVSGVLFQTLSYVCLMLISYGYCVLCERLSVYERRKTAALGVAFYLTLIGYRASLPYFSAFLMLTYLASFYTILCQVSRNLATLREQLLHVGDDNIYTMHESVLLKCAMFRKFQTTMLIVVVMEISMHFNIDASTGDYWLRLSIREWAQFCIYLYIGWTFRSQAVSAHFYVVPNQKVERTLPPIYSIEMDVADFKNLASHSWQLGVPTSYPSSRNQNREDPMIIIVQNPHPMSGIPQTATGRISCDAALPSTAFMERDLQSF